MAVQQLVDDASIEQALCAVMLRVLRPSDETAASALRRLYSAAVGEALLAALDTTTARHQRVVRCRWRLDGGEFLTQRALGAELGVGASRIGGIERAVEDRLRADPGVRDALLPLAQQVSGVPVPRFWLPRPDPLAYGQAVHRRAEDARNAARVRPRTVSQQEAATYLGITAASVDLLVQRGILESAGSECRIESRSLARRRKSVAAEAPPKGSSVREAARFYGIDVATAERWRSLRLLPR